MGGNTRNMRLTGWLYFFSARTGGPVGLNLGFRHDGAARGPRAGYAAGPHGATGGRPEARGDLS